MLFSRLSSLVSRLSFVSRLLLAFLFATLINIPARGVFGQNPDSLRAIYTSFIGVRERTNHNDGTEVEMFLSHVGLSKGAPWCAAFVSYCLHKAGYTHAPRSAWSPDYFPKHRRIYDSGIKSDTQHLPFTVGDVFGIWYSNLGRIAHVGFIDKAESNDFVVTVEGNTNDNGSREGIGVFRKLRPRRTIKYVARY